MAKDTITLTLDGALSLSEFADIMVHFQGLIDGLTEETVGSDRIEWQISHLQSGSATTEIKGISARPNEVVKVVYAYESIGRALELKLPIAYSDEVAAHAIAITGHLNGKIKAVRFRTEDFTASITEPVDTEQHEAAKDYSLGVIVGTVGTLSARPALRISLYDILFDRVVSCYLEPGQQERAREVWGKKVAVTGMVFRDPGTGRPAIIRRVRDIELVETSSVKSYKQVKGILPWKEGDEPPEDTIRRIRDAV